MKRPSRPAPVYRDRGPRIFAYARASTKKQEDSPDTQKQKIKDYVVFAKKATHMDEALGDPTFFVDKATSGKTLWADREAGRELFSQLRAGDHVVIAKLDRAFRRLADCVFVLDRFEKLGVKLHIVNLMGGAIDLSSPMGRFLIHILAAFAELERAFISERTKDGLNQRRQRKVRYTNHPGYGFSWDRRKVDGRNVKVRVRNDEERRVMGSIVAWRMRTPPLSWEEITEHLNQGLNLKTKDGRPWSVMRVRRLCKAELMLQLREQRGLADIN